ncbi:MAG: hypothetical protein FJZ49_08310, partial [Candidatus Verstraetearchaeota archaeon]|nr:hypothetical protein [Candidatus Verstraetearchaeota archaeon]
MRKNNNSKAKARPLESFDDAEKRLKQIFVGLADEIVDAKPPLMRIPLRTASNTVFDEKREILTLGDRASERKFNEIGGVRSFMQTCLLARAIHEALKHDDHPTIRD